MSEVTPQNTNNQNAAGNTLPQPPAQPPKARRVGTITMGLSLVCLGVVLLLRLFFPTINTLYLLQFTPVILVLLGIEILFANLTQKAGKLQYDIVSMLLCLLLIGGTLISAAVPQVVNNHFRYWNNSNGLSYQLEEKAYALLKDSGKVENLHAQVDIGESDLTQETNLATLPIGSSTSIDIELSGSYENKAEFAKTCQQVMEKLKSLSVPVHSLYFYDYNNWNGYSVYQGDKRFSLNLDGKFSQNWTAEQMESHVSVEYWLKGRNGGYYMEESEYRDRVNHPDWYSDDGDYRLPQNAEIAEDSSSVPGTASSSSTSIANAA